MTRWRLLYRVGWELAFASHLDRWRAISRSARRATLPLAYSQGFHQRPRLAMGPPLPVGACGEAELADLYLEDESSPQQETVEALRCALNASACPGLEILRVWLVPMEEQSLTACNYRATWRMEGWWEVIPPSEVTQALLAAPSLPFHRITPKGEKDLDLKPYLLALQTGRDSMEVELLVTPSGGVRWEETCRLFQERGYRFHLFSLCRTSLRHI